MNTSNKEREENKMKWVVEIKKYQMTKEGVRVKETKVKTLEEVQKKIIKKQFQTLMELEQVNTKYGTCTLKRVD